MRNENITTHKLVTFEICSMCTIVHFLNVTIMHTIPPASQYSMSGHLQGFFTLLLIYPNI